MYGQPSPTDAADRLKCVLLRVLLEVLYYIFAVTVSLAVCVSGAVV